MIVERLPVGMLEVNCYILGDEISHKALIIDPGDEPDKIMRCVQRLGLEPIGILLTHGHVDHIRAVPQVSAEYQVSVALSPNDLGLYLSPENALLPWLEAAKDLPRPGSVPTDVPGLMFKMLDTPGHTPGGLSYWFRDAGCVFTGDALFAGGIGRTDLPGGNETQLLQSIRDTLLALPPETIVYPGHGGSTTIGEEKDTNPLLTFPGR